MAIRLHGISHVWQEELLLPGWIDWHKNLFDSMTIINHGGDTEAIVKRLAPTSWKVIPSRLEWFDAAQNDHEVSEVEASLPTSPEDWKICLNTTEMIFTPGFREKLQLSTLQAPHIQAFGSRSVSLVDIEPNDSLSPLDRHHGYIDYERGVIGSRRWRYVHNQDYGHYQLGRHGVDLPATEMPDWLLLYWQLAPYPLCRDRKKNIKNRIPPEHFQIGWGIQHNIDDDGLDRLYREERARSYNLFEFPLYKEYYEFWRQRKENE